MKQGWRYFACECGRNWKSGTFDHESNRNEVCPKCATWIRPYHSWPDPTAEDYERKIFPDNHRAWVVNAVGWVGLCPVYLADVEGEALIPIPRLPVLDFWLVINIHAQKAAHFLRKLLGLKSKDYEFSAHNVLMIKPMELIINLH
jgi:hypothetical protein